MDCDFNHSVNRLDWPRARLPALLLKQDTNPATMLNIEVWFVLQVATSRVHLFMLRRITYTSVATTHFSKRSLLDLLHHARAFNKIDEITGLLIYDNGHFLQVVEGPRDAVEKLLARLKRDSRHERFKVHQDELIQTRLFPDWRMGFGDLSDPALLFLPGFITNSEQEDRVRLLVDQMPALAEQLRAALAE